jgi:DUF4097 and DUF4098 domain-containing protein YvlB
MPHWDFPATEPIDLLVEVTAGSVRITAEQTQTVTVDVRPTRPDHQSDELAAEVQVDFADGRLEIVESSQPHNWIRFNSGLDVSVALPAGSRCWVTTATAAVNVSGELGSLAAKSISGEVVAGAITGNAEVSTTSGRIGISETAGDVSAKSASGAVDLGHVGGDVGVNTVSGKVEIGVAAADVTVRSASGRVKIGRLSRGRAEIVTVSGDIKVHIAKGAGVYLDMSSLSGRVTSELEPSEADDQVDLQLQCRSISGAVKVGRAELADVS